MTLQTHQNPDEMTSGRGQASNDEDDERRHPGVGRTTFGALPRDETLGLGAVMSIQERNTRNAGVRKPVMVRSLNPHDPPQAALDGKEGGGG